jgi:two-component system chemotaxis response regulator CheB
MFTSAADVYGDRVIGVVLTGILRDGTAGLRAVHDRGGLTIVQDPTGAEYADMPRSAREGLPVTFSLALRDIGPALDLLSRRSTHLETGLTVSAQLLRKRVELLVRLRAQSGANVDTCTFIDEELLSLRRDLGSIDRLLRSVPLKGRRS